MKKILLVTLLCVWAVIGYGQSQAFNAEVLYSQETLGYNNDINLKYISEENTYVYTASNSNNNSASIVTVTEVLKPNRNFAVVYVNANNAIDEKLVKCLYDIHKGAEGYCTMYKGCFVYATTSAIYLDMCHLIDEILNKYPVYTY